MRAPNPLRAIRILSACLGLSALPGSGLVVAQEVPATGVATVTYLNASTAYVDAGELDGVRVDDEMDVIEGDRVVTTLRVIAVASHRASCQRLDPEAPVAIGAMVRIRSSPDGLHPVEPPVQSPSSRIEEPGKRLARPSPGARREADPRPSPSDRRSIREWLRNRGLRGRLGLRYFGLRDWTGYGRSLSQPQADLRIDGPVSPDLPLFIHVDARTRRTDQRFDDGSHTTEDRTRINRLSVTWGQSDGPWRLTGGRQSSPSLGAAGIFDGISGEIRRGEIRLGLLTGTQPDPATNDLSSRILQHGAYVHFEKRPPGGSRRSLSAGFLGSYRDGEVNRESFHLQGRYLSSRFTGSVMQDIDLNRGWKHDMGEKRLSPTSTFLMANYRIGPSLHINGGFDNRRMVRLFTESAQLQSTFDDRYRQGLWTGVRATVTRRSRVGLTLRLRTGGSTSSANTASAYGEMRWPRYANLTLRLNSSAYRNHVVSGRMHSLNTRIDLVRQVRSSLTWGYRPERSDDGTRTRHSWIAIELERSFARAWYLMLSGERSRGDGADHLQIHTSTSYRF